MNPDSRRLRFVYFLIAGSGLVSVARAMSLSFLAVKLQKSFGLGPAAIGILLGTGPLLGAIAAPLAGSLSDRVGRVLMLVLMLALTALALIGMGFAQSVTAFCAAQIVAAVSIAVYEPISRALMSDICPPERRLKYFSWRYMVANAGWAVGPLIGVAAGTALSAMFMVAGCIYAVFATALHLLGTPETVDAEKSESHRQPSVVESIRSAARDPRLAFFVGGGTLLLAVYGQWSATLAPYLGATMEGGVDIFAYLLSINGLVVLVGNLFARRLIEKVGALHAMVLGCVLILASELGFLASSSFTGFALFMVLFTVGEILVVPSEYLLVDGICNARNRGSYFGAHSFSTIGNFFGPALGGLMLGAFGGTGMFLTFAAFAAASAVMFTIGMRMPPPHPRAEGAPASSAIEVSGLSRRLHYA